MFFDESFDHAYECDLIESPEGGIPMFCYPGGIAGGWVQGIGVKITPHSEAETWIGSFANGDVSPNAASGIFTHPERHQVFIVAKGDGHIVNVNRPTEFVWLDQIVPIMGVVPVPDLGRILLYDFTRLLAIGEGGVLWRTPCLSWDGLTIESVKDGVVHGYGWDAPNNRNVPFEVNALTGECCGGASSPVASV